MVDTERASAAPPPARYSVVARDLTRQVSGAGTILDRVSLAVQSGELIGIAGGSGAGKSTLLDALAGVRRADGGSVWIHGLALQEHGEAIRGWTAYVPQDDIIHMDLPLERTLTYAARLRLPSHLGSEEIATRVRDAMSQLDLSERRSTPVRLLSGGQRKRASIAAELLTNPRVFFLDEPTSGLDPATSAGLLRTLRSLTETGATVIFTTHATQDLEACDRVAFMASGGRLVFLGSLEAARDRFGVKSATALYERLDGADAADSPNPEEPRAVRPTPISPETASRRSSWAQWRVLTARTFESLARNRLTLAILLGSPAMIVALFVILFRGGAFDPADPQPTTILMILFWITFGSFFFGVTYGLLQIVGERPILRRERHVGLRLGPYLFSKVAVLLPFLALVNVLMLVVLRALDRLPSGDLGTYVTVATTLMLGASAALTLGLLASAAVRDAAQATLALPMLCFPAVLFSGAILPVHVMARAGKGIAAIVPVRWAFEAVGHDLGVRTLLLEGGSPLGPPLVQTFGSAGTYATTTYWGILSVFSVGFFAATWIVLRRTADRGGR